jgi:hypothetical protein
MAAGHSVATVALNGWLPNVNTPGDVDRAGEWLIDGE